MYKPKHQRVKSPVVDMTAMCDVAFLILLFFILVARPSALHPLKINEPGISSYPVCAFSEDNNATIMIGENKVLLKIDDEKIREQALLQMGRLYNIHFSIEEVKKFGQIDIVCTPIAELKTFIDDYPRNSFVFKGIPVTAENSELLNWLKISKKLDKDLYDKSLDFTIDGDKNTNYPAIRSAIDVLAALKVYKFALTATALPRTKLTK